jgi:hypothetical protein
MNERECLSKMIAPGQKRESKWRQGVIQIWVTRTCDKSCYSCTQGSNLGGKPEFITPEQFEQACISLKGYFGVVGMFGGNPATHPRFHQLCDIMKEHIPFEQRGIWCNNPIKIANANKMRETFNPQYSNLNVHLDEDAYRMFKAGWPESMPCGLKDDSRHSPPFVAMKDVIVDEAKRWELISGCDINRYWSAMIGVFRGQLRAWFCEIAGAQSMLHQHDPDYPDTGMNPNQGIEYGNGLMRWWERSIYDFAYQVKKHCHECGVPLRGYGQLSQSEIDHEQVSETHKDIYKPKRIGREVELVTELVQLGKPLERMTNYIQNSKV